MSDIARKRPTQRRAAICERQSWCWPTRGSPAPGIAAAAPDRDGVGRGEGAGHGSTAVGAGEITPEEGTAVAGVLEIKRKAIETSELEARIVAQEDTRRSASWSWPQAPQPRKRASYVVYREPGDLDLDVESRRAAGCPVIRRAATVQDHRAAGRDGAVERGQHLSLRQRLGRLENRSASPVHAGHDRRPAAAGDEGGLACAYGRPSDARPREQPRRDPRPVGQPPDGRASPEAGPMNIGFTYGAPDRSPDLLDPLPDMRLSP